MLKVLYYFDSIVYFILTAAVHSRNRCSNNQMRQFALIRDIAELLKYAIFNFKILQNDGILLSFSPLVFSYL